MHGGKDRPSDDETDWRDVSLILVAGVIGACQISKVAIAVPLLREDLGTSLLVLAWVAGAYAILGVLGGVLAGFAVSWFSLRRVVIAGLVLISAGNALGCFADGAGLLIVSRVVEGVGFLGLAVACPALLRSNSAPRHQNMVLAAWAAYVPAGGALMLFFGPAIMQGDWRWLWIVNGALAGLNAAALLLSRPRRNSAGPALVRPNRSDVMAVLTAWPPLLLAGAFALHGIQFFALSTFLPVLVVDRLGYSLATAGTISASALAAAAVGNLCGGMLRRSGLPLAYVIGFAFSVVLICGPIVFVPGMPALAVVLAACACFGLTGLLPATVIASMPLFAPSPQRMALGMGLIQQASSTAQVVGPVALASWVQFVGWPSVSYLFGLIGLTGIALAATLHGVARR
jgi:MFS family permease